MSPVTYVEPEFSEGQEVELEVAEGPLKGRYEVVLDRVRSGRLEVPVPTRDGLYLPLPSGSKLMLRVYRSGCYRENQVELLERVDLASPPIFILSRPRRMKEVQLRDHHRVDCQFDVEVVPLDSTLVDPGVIEGEARDLSAGGMKIVSPRGVPEDTRVRCSFVLPIIDVDPGFIFGNVVRSVPAEEGDSHHLAVEFRGLTQSQEDDIIRYTFKQQMRLKHQRE